MPMIPEHFRNRINKLHGETGEIDGRLNRREPGSPYPALSKEEKKRNRPSTIYYIALVRFT